MLVLATLLVCLNLALSGSLSIDFIKSLDADPASPPRLPTFPETPNPDDGPIAVVAEVRIDKEDRELFFELMHEVRLTYLRNGASTVRLYESLANHSLFRMEAVSPTCQEHRLLHRRMTKTERDALDRVFKLHKGEGGEVLHYVLVTKRIAGSPEARIEFSG